MLVNGLPDFGDYKEIMHPCPSLELSTKKRISVKCHKRNFYDEVKRRPGVVGQAFRLAGTLAALE
jgi:hypothetical protein